MTDTDTTVDEAVENTETADTENGDVSGRVAEIIGEGEVTQVSALQSMYNLFFRKIEDVDAILDAQAGGRSASKRVVLNQLVKDNEDAIVSAVAQFRAFLDEEVEDDSVRVAIFSGVVKSLKAAYDPQVESVLETLVQDVPEVAPLPAEELEAYTTARKKLYAQCKSNIEMLELFGENPADYPMPKRRSGGRGSKRGARKISLYTWKLDGEQLSADEDSVLAISKKLGFEKKSDLTKLMRDAELNLTDPPDPIHFVLTVENSKDGVEHTLHGVRRVASEGNPEDDEDDDGDDDEDGEDAE